MRGIVWSTMIKILIVLAVVFMMSVVFGRAFAEGTNVLEGGLDWIEDRTSIPIGPSDRMHTLNLGTPSGNSIAYVVDLAPGDRENELEVRVTRNGEQYTEEISADESGTVSFSVDLSSRLTNEVQIQVWDRGDTDRLVSNTLEFNTIDLARLESGPIADSIDDFTESDSDETVYFEAIVNSCGVCEGSAFDDNYNLAASAVEYLREHSCNEIHQDTYAALRALHDCDDSPGGVNIIVRYAANIDKAKADFREAMEACAENSADGAASAIRRQLSAYDDMGDLMQEMSDAFSCSVQSFNLAGQLYCNADLDERDRCWLSRDCATPSFSCSQNIVVIQQ